MGRKSPSPILLLTTNLATAPPPPPPLTRDGGRRGRGHSLLTSNLAGERGEKFSPCDVRSAVREGDVREEGRKKLSSFSLRLEWASGDVIHDEGEEEEAFAAATALDQK